MRNKAFLKCSGANRIQVQKNWRKE